MRNERIKRNLSIIPGVGIFALLQILFFWLAPDIASRNILYILLTGISLLHCGLSIVMASKFPWRRCIPFILCGSLILAGVGAAVICGFWFEVSVRTASYLGISCFLVYLIIAIPVLLDRIGREPEDTLSGHENRENINAPIMGSSCPENGRTLPPRPTVNRRC